MHGCRSWSQNGLRGHIVLPELPGQRVRCRAGRRAAAAAHAQILARDVLQPLSAPVPTPAPAFAAAGYVRPCPTLLPPPAPRGRAPRRPASAPAPAPSPAATDAVPLPPAPGARRCALRANAHVRGRRRAAAGQAAADGRFLDGRVALAGSSGHSVDCVCPSCSLLRVGAHDPRFDSIHLQSCCWSVFAQPVRYVLFTARRMGFHLPVRNIRC